MSVAGRPARFTMSREPAVVNHGPASTRPVTSSVKPTSSSSNWLPTAPGFPGGVKVREQSNAGSERDESKYSRRSARDSPGHTQRRNLYAAQREAADTTAASGTPIKAIAMSTNVSERSPCAKGAPVKGTLYSSGRTKKKSAKPTATPARDASAASTAETTEI